MNENAASRASAIRCPGGRSAAGARAGEAQSSSPASARTRPQSTCASMKSAIASSRASSASVSPACTRPRWRSGSAILSLRGRTPTTGTPVASIASDDEPAMALAADAIDDDAGDAEPCVVICRAAPDDGRRRLRLPRDIEDEQHRHAQRGGDVGRGAAAAGLRRNAVEEAHRGFAQRELACSRRARGERGQKLGRHGPGLSRLTPSRPDAAAWKAGSI